MVWIDPIIGKPEVVSPGDSGVRPCPPFIEQTNRDDLTAAAGLVQQRIDMAISESDRITVVG